MNVKFKGVILDSDSYIYKACCVGTTFSDKKKIINTIFSSLKDISDCNEVIGYIGINSDKSFRKGLYADYKLNRLNMKRPEHLKELSQYLNEYKGFIFVSGIEADDACSISANYFNTFDPDNNYLVISNDKDLLQIPTYHYNPNLTKISQFIDVKNKSDIFISKDKKVFTTGKYRLFNQILQGDSADNIKGIPKVGPIKSYNIIKDVKEEDLESICKKEYINYYGEDDGLIKYKLNKNLCELLTDYTLIPHYEFVTLG